MESDGAHREVAGSRPGKIIKNEKEITCILIDVAKTRGHKCHAKRSRKETKIQEMHIYFVEPYSGFVFNNLIFIFAYMYIFPCWALFILNNQNASTCTKIKRKYRTLCVEIQRMWNLKCTFMVEISGATGIVTRG
jgi:hypothetical protein